MENENTANDHEARLAEMLRRAEEDPKAFAAHVGRKADPDPEEPRITPLRDHADEVKELQPDDEPEESQ